MQLKVRFYSVRAVEPVTPAILFLDFFYFFSGEWLVPKSWDHCFPLFLDYPQPTSQAEYECRFSIIYLTATCRGISVQVHVLLLRRLFADTVSIKQKQIFTVTLRGVNPMSLQLDASSTDFIFPQRCAYKWIRPWSSVKLTETGNAILVSQFFSNFGVFDLID